MADGKASEVAKGIRKFARHVSDLFIKNPAKRFANMLTQRPFYADCQMTVLGVNELKTKHMIIREGMLRKRSSNSVLTKAMETMNIKWSMFYVVVTEESIYYFKNESSQSCVGKFTLCGYNVVCRCPEYFKTGSSWPDNSFLIRHASGDDSYRTYVFAGLNPTDTKEWMRDIRTALIKANIRVVTSIRGISGQDPSIEEIEEEIYRPTDFPGLISNMTIQHDDMESDNDDYSIIDDNETDHSRHGDFEQQRRRKGSVTSSDLGYVDFEEEDFIAKTPPKGTLSPQRKGPHSPPSSFQNNLVGELRSAVTAMRKLKSPSESVEASEVHGYRDTPPETLPPKPPRPKRNESPLQDEDETPHGHLDPLISSTHQKPPPSLPSQKPLPSLPCQKPLPSIPNQKRLPSIPNQKPLPAPPSKKQPQIPPLSQHKPISRPPYQKSLPDQVSVAISEKPLPDHVSVAISEKPLPDHVSVAISEKPLPELPPKPEAFSFSTSPKPALTARPVVANKPTLRVKPSIHTMSESEVTNSELELQPRAIFWVGDKDEASRRLRQASLGEFVVRLSGTEANSYVLVIADGASNIYSVRIFPYSQGCYGMKKEEMAQDHDMFSSVEELTHYYSQAPISLRDGTLEITLTRPLSDCRSSL